MRDSRSLLRAVLVGMLVLVGVSYVGVAQDAGLDTMARKDIRPTDVVIWSAPSGILGDDGRVSVTLTLETRDGFNIYANRIEFHGPDGMEPESVRPPAARTIPDPLGEGDASVYTGGEFTVVLSGLSPWTSMEFPIAVRYTACARGICLFPYTQTIPVTLTRGVVESIAATGGDAMAATKDQPATPDGAERDDAVDLESKWAAQLGAGALPYWVVLLIALLAGFATNLTPCVYPMIPITIRLLSRAGKSPWLAGIAYASGILVTYTSLGLVASLSGKMFGSLLASASFNITFAVIMAVLGLTMLGFGNFSGLQNVGMKVSASSAGTAKTFLMGVGAGFVASPCTGPVLAALLAYTATGQNVAGGALLLFTYSLGFALPYVFLGRLAARLADIRAGERTQLIVKIVFGAVMFALAFYYLRVPAYALTVVLKPWWGVCASWGMGLGVVAVSAWLARESWRANKFVSLIPAVVLGFGIFATAQWITSPKGIVEGPEVTILHSESEAFEAARASGKPILIDAWAEWCEACKKMDATTFRDPAVREELAARWVVVKFDLTEENDANTALQEKYGLQSLPVLVMMSADGARKESSAGYVPAATLLAKLRGWEK